MRPSLFVLAGIMMLSSRYAAAAGHVLDGGPVSLSRAQTWCIAPNGPLPNWDGPGHPECKMVWRVLAERGDRILYSVRYAWPSPARSTEPLRVLTEVLYEGLRGSRIVRKLYAVQDDEALVRLDPLRLVTLDGTNVIESRVCMAATGECGREFATWTGKGVEAVENNTVAEIRSQLPKGYDVKMNPELDLASMSGSGKAWAARDADCCPSAAFAFTLHLDANALHVKDVKLTRRGA